MRIVVVGGGKLGFSLAESLINEGHNVTVVDRNESVLQKNMDTLDAMFIKGSGVSACKFSKFHQLFFSEGEVTERFSREFLFSSDRIRHMQQRARSSDHYVFCTDSTHDFSEQGILLCVIGTPDVLAVHDAGEQERILRETGLD